MSNSRWGAVFALGLIAGGGLAIIAIIWIIGLNYCPNHPCYYSQATDEPGGNTDQRVWQVPDAVRGTFSYETEPEYAEGNPTRQEYYDLRAQERMAHATDWIAWLTLVTGVVGLTGLGALIYTLNLQRDANRIMRQEQRAWLSLDLQAASDLTFKDGEGRLVFEFKIKNHGTTPAVFVNILAECSAAPLGEFKVLEELRKRTNRPMTKRGLAGFKVFPGQTHVSRINMPFPIERDRDEIYSVWPERGNAASTHSLGGSHRTVRQRHRVAQSHNRIYEPGNLDQKQIGAWNRGRGRWVRCSARLDLATHYRRRSSHIARLLAPRP